MRRSRLLFLAVLAAVFFLVVSRAEGRRPPPARVLAGLLCIHHYEGSWTDPGAPYYGGLQMDWSFMATYGGEFLAAWGTADHWPVWVQLVVGMRGYFARGWSPWPNTSRACGLR
jgi:hypothetical protein